MLERAEQPENTLDSTSFVMAEENLTDCRLMHLSKQKVGRNVIELLEKSMLPERFAHN